MESHDGHEKKKLREAYEETKLELEIAIRPLDQKIDELVAKE